MKYYMWSIDGVVEVSEEWADYVSLQEVKELLQKRDLEISTLRSIVKAYQLSKDPRKVIGFDANVETAERLRKEREGRK